MAWPLLSQQQQYWLAHVQGCASSGLSMRDYADRHGFEAQEFYCWKRHLKTLGVLSAPAYSEACAADHEAGPFILETAVAYDKAEKAVRFQCHALRCQRTRSVRLRSS